MSNYIATQHFRLQGISIAEGQMLPDGWGDSLVRRIVAKGLARPMTAEEAVSPGIPSAPSANAIEPVLSVLGRDPDMSELPGVVVVTMSCYPDIFAKLRDGMNYWEPNVRKIVVTSGTAKYDAPGWEIIPGIEPFCFGRNANVGIRAAGANDVLLVNDDVRLTGPVIRALRDTAYRHEQVGILAPQVNGGCGNLTQKVATRIHGDIAFPTVRLAFIAVYLKHSTLARVGLFDEQFVGYGSEDTDYCIRVERAGLKCAVTPNAVVIHGHGVASSSSFLRKMSRQAQVHSMGEMRKRLEAKLGAAR